MFQKCLDCEVLLCFFLFDFAHILGVLEHSSVILSFGLLKLRVVLAIRFLAGNLLEHQVNLIFNTEDRVLFCVVFRISLWICIFPLYDSFANFILKSILLVPCLNIVFEFLQALKVINWQSFITLGFSFEFSICRFLLQNEGADLIIVLFLLLLVNLILGVNAFVQNRF